jgi:hypothetical protein
MWKRRPGWRNRCLLALIVVGALTTGSCSFSQAHTESAMVATQFADLSRDVSSTLKPVFADSVLTADGQSADLWVPSSSTDGVRGCISMVYVHRKDSGPEFFEAEDTGCPAPRFVSLQREPLPISSFESASTTAPVDFPSVVVGSVGSIPATRVRVSLAGIGMTIRLWNGWFILPKQLTGVASSIYSVFPIDARGAVLGSVALTANSVGRPLTQSATR